MPHISNSRSPCTERRCPNKALLTTRIAPSLIHALSGEDLDRAIQPLWLYECRRRDREEMYRLKRH
jgi:hypothetical protein